MLGHILSFCLPRRKMSKNNKDYRKAEEVRSWRGIRFSGSFI